MSGPGRGRGRFITFEGGEGAGKSTQARLLVAALRARGLAAVLTREPGGTPGAEAIRGLLLGTGDNDTDWGLGAEALLFAAARADHVARVIRPTLLRGDWVICDRFIDSSRAYQGFGLGGLNDDDILTLHRIGSGGFLPDLTMLIEVSPHRSAARLAERDRGASDRIGGRAPSYHRYVAQAFARIAEAEPARFRVVDGDADAATVHAAVLARLAPWLGEGV